MSRADKGDQESAEAADRLNTPEKNNLKYDYMQARYSRRMKDFKTEIEKTSSKPQGNNQN